MPMTTATQPKEDINGLLDERQAANLIGVTTRFMQQRRRTGDGPVFIRVSSRCVRYRLRDITAWIEQRMRKSTSDDGKNDE